MTIVPLKGEIEFLIGIVQYSHQLIEVGTKGMCKCLSVIAVINQGIIGAIGIWLSIVELCQKVKIFYSQRVETADTQLCCYLPVQRYLSVKGSIRKRLEFAVEPHLHCAARITTCHLAHRVQIRICNGAIRRPICPDQGMKNT